MTLHDAMIIIAEMSMELFQPVPMTGKVILWYKFIDYSRRFLSSVCKEQGTTPYALGGSDPHRVVLGETSERILQEMRAILDFGVTLN